MLEWRLFIVFGIVSAIVVSSVFFTHLPRSQVVVLLVLFTLRDLNWLDIGLELELRVQTLIHIILIRIMQLTEQAFVFNAE